MRGHERLEPVGPVGSSLRTSEIWRLDREEQRDRQADQRQRRRRPSSPPREEVTEDAQGVAHIDVQA